MNTLVVGADLAAQLRLIREPVQVCDGDGRMLGTFIPAIDLSEWDTTLPPPLDEQELKRRMANDRRLTTAQFVRELEEIADPIIVEKRSRLPSAC